MMMVMIVVVQVTIRQAALGFFSKFLLVEGHDEIRCGM